VFSPYYAWAGRKSPENHTAMNVALYGPRGGRWAMTERTSRTLMRDATALTIGPSHLWWNRSALEISIDEIASPLPRRIKGRVRILPAAVTTEPFLLDRHHLHRWWPIAPLARIEVELEHPSLSWTGAGYLDMNVGDEPLEDGFSRWDWCRGTHELGATLLYQVTLPTGERGALTLIADRHGKVDALEATTSVSLPRSPIWRVDRGTRSEKARPARVLRTLEDTPFYARSKVATRLAGQDVVAMHESLSLDRFSSPVVKMMLPFRMPRIPW